MLAEIELLNVPSANSIALPADIVRFVPLEIVPSVKYKVPVIVVGLLSVSVLAVVVVLKSISRLLYEPAPVIFVFISWSA